MDKRKHKLDDPAVDEIEQAEDADDLTVRTPNEPEKARRPPGEDDDSDDEREDENEAVRGD